MCEGRIYEKYTKVQTYGNTGRNLRAKLKLTKIMVGALGRKNQIQILNMFQYLHNIVLSNDCIHSTRKHNF